MDVFSFEAVDLGLRPSGGEAIRRPFERMVSAPTRQEAAKKAKDELARSLNGRPFKWITPPEMAVSSRRSRVYFRAALVATV